MLTLAKIGRFTAIGLAGLFIMLSLGGIFGVWFVSRKASDVALKMFGIIEIGVGVADAGVGRVDDLIATSRTEVRQAAETIGAVGGQAVANSPVLTALNERLETNLAPRIAQMQQALASGARCARKGEQRGEHGERVAGYGGTGAAARRFG